MFKITREFYIPKNAEKREYPDLSARERIEIITAMGVLAG